MMRTATVQAIQKWEYETVTTKTEHFLSKELNEMGQLGWELVCVIEHKDRKGEIAWSAFIKRPYVPHPAEPARAQTLESTEGTAGSSDSGKSGQVFDLSGSEVPDK